MDLEFLYNEPIKEMQELSPGYDDHASDVWLVKTKKQEVVVRSSRMTEEPNNDFWWGCKKIFGIDPRQVYELERVNNNISEITTLPIPKVINKGKRNSKEFVIVERLNGNTLESFKNQPSTVLQSLGEGLARIHNHKKNYVGNPSGTFKISLEEFNQHLKDTMTELVARFYNKENEIQEKLVEIKMLLDKAPTPKSSTFVLVDMDPTQFLYDGKVISGLVDTEAYVIASREFDFIGLEYVLDEKSALDFKIGYEKFMELPDLTKVREP